MTADQIFEDLRNLGIRDGDKLFVHSALSKLGFVEGGSEAVIDALKKSVGPEGTLLFPTFTFPGGGVYATISDENYIFDVDVDRSYTGKISETFRTMQGVFRSIHPTHSVAAYGKLAENIVSHHIDLGSSFGEGTPFGKMIDLNVKIIALGVPISMFTFFHCLEDYHPEIFPGLFHENTMTIKVRKEGTISNYEMPYHNPDFTTDRIEKNPTIEKYFADYFLETAKLKKGKVGNADTLLINSQDLFNIGLELAKSGKTVYSI